MSMSFPRKVFLTFDVEDFINERSTKALYHILKMLDENKLKAIFFITGHMAEKLVRYKEIVELLSEHQIGYHSSSHSVRPTILEYTDVESYEEARLESLKRETSHINPLTGEIEGKGGIHILRELFPNVAIKAFRAPDYCWSPPHLEALKELGIEYDFSTKLSPEPVRHRGITFYPYPICHDWTGKNVYIKLVRSVLYRRFTVLNFHHWHFVNSKAWNWYYKNGNPKKLRTVEPLSPRLAQNRLTTFKLFLNKIQSLWKINAIEVTPELKKSLVSVDVDKHCLEEICGEIVYWFKTYYGYEASFLCNHFRKFFSVH
jgi:peptidoglycan/xylan/chitin deacetylase (PgdA/CDA1 family)